MSTTMTKAAFPASPATSPVTSALEETLSNLLNQHSFWAMLYYDRMKITWSEAIPTAGTDGHRIIINPKFFLSLTLGQRVFLFAHEIAHAMFDHPLRMKRYAREGTLRGFPYDHSLANIAQDLIINDMLVRGRIGTVIQGCVHDPNYGTAGDLFEDVYEKLCKKKPPNKGRGKSKPGDGQGQGQGQGQPTTKPKGTGRMGSVPAEKQTVDQAVASGDNLDEHLQPDDMSPAEESAEAAEWQRAMQAAKAAAKAQGHMPASLEGIIENILSPQVPWYEKLQRLMKRITRGVGARSFKRLARRKLVFDPIMVLPGRVGFGAECIVCVNDSSGSVSDQEYTHYIAEASGIITDVRPRDLYVIQGDAEVKDVTRLPGGMGFAQTVARKGYGGTNFCPPFERVREMGLRPDVLIYFTDGYGPAPEHPPSYPVIWVITTDVEPPWGHHIKLSVER